MLLQFSIQTWEVVGSEVVGFGGVLQRALFPYQDQFLDVVKISATRLWRVKSGNYNRTRFASMRRSLSLGSFRSSGEFEGGRQAVGGEFGGGHVEEVEPPLRNEWIKVRAINPDGDDRKGGGSGDGQGDAGESSGATI